MTILTALKRTTAVAALAALPLAPVAVLAESALVTGTQPPAANEQAGTPTTPQQATDQSDVGATQTQGEPGQTGTQSGEAPDQAQQSQTAPAGQSANQTGQQETGQTGEQTTQTQGEPGQSGTQSGQAPDQAQQGQTAPTGQSARQTGQQETGQAGEQTTQTQGEPGQSGTQSGQAPQQGTEGQMKAGADEDAVVAKVGDREIRRSDVLMVIGMLPPQLQQQPPEMLIPIALDQLVMRELILQEAKEAGLEGDPAVSSLDEGAPERAKEDAMVQVWLDNELGKAVTDAEVEQTYETVKQQLGDQAPSMEELRPQIEQELRQQAFLDISKDLQADAEITLYGPDGQPLSQ